MKITYCYYVGDLRYVWLKELVTCIFNANLRTNYNINSLVIEKSHNFPSFYSI